MDLTQIGDSTCRCQVCQRVLSHADLAMSVAAYQRHRKDEVPPRAKIHDWSGVVQMDLIWRAQLRQIDREMGRMKRKPDSVESRLAAVEERLERMDRDHRLWPSGPLPPGECRRCGGGSGLHMRGGVCPGGVGFFEE